MTAHGAVPSRRCPEEPGRPSGDPAPLPVRRRWATPANMEHGHAFFSKGGV